MVMILFMEKWDDSNPSSWMKNPPSPTTTLLITQLPNGQGGLHRGLQGMDTNTRFGLIKTKNRSMSMVILPWTLGGLFLPCFFHTKIKCIYNICCFDLNVPISYNSKNMDTKKTSTTHRGRHKWHSRSWVSRPPLPGRTERSLDQQPETGGRSTLMNR